MGNIFSNIWQGITGGFNSLFGNYTDQQKQDIANNGKQAQKNIQDNKDANGGQYDPVYAVTGISLGSLKNEMDWGMILVGALLAYFVIFKD